MFLFSFRIRSAFGTDGNSSLGSQAIGRPKGVKVPKGTPGEAKQFLQVIENEFRRRINVEHMQSSEARMFTEDALLQLAV